MNIKPNFDLCISPVGTEGRRHACTALRNEAGYNEFAQLMTEANGAARLLYGKAKHGDMTPAAEEALKVCVPTVAKVSTFDRVIDLLGLGAKIAAKTHNQEAVVGEEKEEEKFSHGASDKVTEPSQARTLARIFTHVTDANLLHLPPRRICQSCRLHVVKYLADFDSDEAIAKEDT